MKIGIFDSGSGGLRTLYEIEKILRLQTTAIQQSLSLHYYADTQYLPYGNKQEIFLQNRSIEILKYLSQSCGIVLNACNTSSSILLKNNAVLPSTHTPNYSVFSCTLADVTATIQTAILQGKDYLYLAFIATNRTCQSATPVACLQNFLPSQHMTVFSLKQLGNHAYEMCIGYQDTRIVCHIFLVPTQNLVEWAESPLYFLPSWELPTKHYGFIQQYIQQCWEEIVPHGLIVDHVWISCTHFEWYDAIWKTWSVGNAFQSYQNNHNKIPQIHYPSQQLAQCVVPHLLANTENETGDGQTTCVGSIAKHYEYSGEALGRIL
jgi:glutamate racemase